VSTVADLRHWVRAARAAGKSIGLVPTMGALHEGHLSLARASQAECDLTVVTIFVNPTQFGPQEDFGKYPRTLEADLESLRTTGADLVFVPTNAEMYPADFSTYVEPPRSALRWEGECRPGHFRGVATIVLKLFNAAQADIAFFGQKDYQQVAVIRQMVRDLDVPVEIRVCPTVREPDGLAMSSRNRYLSLDERRQAVALSRGLKMAEQLASQGQRDASALIASVRQTLHDAGITRIDYVAVVDSDSLEPVAELNGPAVVLIAAFVGGTRLIDNWRIGE
jgi:pantoate--beta-alanine ligase